ncbi:sigmak-factor processing regulatory bofa [Lucifera butyrica]|uniref:Sigmak-factor processing regulatory bofa n=1 Tax=Lucifera butyrica TaxID=1351585 RepID=A0A498R6C7_9FIRM|nr:pro-sigmaK processing inhibitor BofA family protein [Lucifera butyrica]VBB06961.1 sigmak-factor processing regulatory bofa [Lucifera butyrica]
MSMLPGFNGDWHILLAYGFGILLIYLIGRVFLMPIKIVFRLIYNALIGGLMLWALNYIGGHFGFIIGINPVTALVAGFLGLPGVILLILFKIFIGGV